MQCSSILISDCNFSVLLVSYNYKQNDIKYLNQKLKHQLGKQMVSTANHLIPIKLGLHNVYVYKTT